MNDFINSPPLPEYREEERCDYNTQGPVIRELTWQRDQLKLSLDEMAAVLFRRYRKILARGIAGTERDEMESIFNKHGYLPRKEPETEFRELGVGEHRDFTSKTKLP